MCPSLLVGITALTIFQVFPTASAFGKFEEDSVKVRFVEDIVQPNTSLEDKRRGFILFVRHYMDRIYPNSIPKREEASDHGEILATLGEYEPFQFGIYPLRDLKKVQIKPGPLTTEEGEIIPANLLDIRFVHYWETKVGGIKPNKLMVLPKTLEKRESIDILKGVARGVWVTVKVPNYAKPGLYRGKLFIKYKEGTQSAFNLSVRVYPFRLIEPGKVLTPLYIQDLGYQDTTRLYSEDTLRKKIQDLKAHGMTAISPLSEEEADQRYGHPSVKSLEKTIEICKEQDFKVPVYFFMGKIAKAMRSRNRVEKDYDSVKHPKIVREIVSYYKRKAEKEGWPEVYFMPTDEPQKPEKLTQAAREVLAAVKDAGGKTALASSHRIFKEYGDLVDVRIYSERRWGEREIKDTKKAGKKFFIYPNSAVVRHGTVYPRFVFGFWSWGADFDGVTPWTYPLEQEYTAKGSWLGKRAEDGPETQNGFLGIDGNPISTIQWECVREGIDDLRYIRTLEKLIEESNLLSDSGVKPIRERAISILEEIKKTIIPDARAYNFELMVKRPEGEPRGGIYWTPQQFDKNRRRIAEAIISLQKVLQKK